MSRFNILVKCPFCPCLFVLESPTSMTGPLYHLQGIIFCPFCDTRIVGQRGERPGRELDVIPFGEEQAQWFAELERAKG